MSVTGVSCGDPPTNIIGSHDVPTMTTFGGTVTYTCVDGYTLFGTATVTCEANGEWSTPPTCTGRVYCVHMY